MTPIPQFPGTTSQIAAPRNKAELEALAERRDELNDQLESLNDRRRELATQIGMLGSDPAIRSGPVGRLQALDQRIAVTEADIERSDKLIAEAKAKGIGNEEHVDRPGVPSLPTMPALPSMPEFVFTDTHQPSWQDRIGPVLATTVPITLASVVLLGALMYWRISRSVRNQLAKIMATQSGRLDEIQRSVDTVAVEMERVSENQRFVTKLVGEKGPALPVDRR